MIIGVDARELCGRPTGTGRYLRNLLREWSRQGDDSIIAYFNGQPPADAVLDAPGLRSRSLGAAKRRGVLWQQVVLPLSVRADRLDVLFSPAYFCPIGVRLPRVTTVHDMSCFYCPKDFSLADRIRRRILVSASIRVSSVVLAVSRFTRDEIVRRFPSAADRVEHIHLGTDDDLPPGPPKNEARRLLALDGPLVLSIGSIFNRRRAPELVRAFAAVSRLFPRATLDIVGDNRTTPRLDLAGIAAALGVSRNVRVSGFVDEAGLAARLSAADVFVSLSDYEGFGLTALEAMARGIPVVAADRLSLSEICGEAAWLVDPGDISQIAAAIVSLLSDPGRHADFVARGLHHVTRFAWSTTAVRTREALAAAASKR
ncbi:MAG: glycosyltransferase family 4 protein [Vicinamibacteria bacterium]|nr:glycosyltransferase family 4 protein [Vicinamibacteria bacterium]